MAGGQGQQSRVTLEVELRAGEAPEATQHVWIFAGESLAVGRNADFSLDSDLAMSRRHFQISFDGRTCELQDLQSSNGTQVNGKPVKAAVLVDGDRIEAGRSLLRVRVEVAASTEGSPGSGLPPLAASGAFGGELDQTAVQNNLPRTVMLQLLTESDKVANAGMLSRFMAWIRSGQSIVVGNSGFDADWRIPNDPRMAPRHFCVAFDGTAAVLRCLAPEAGTLVNDQPVQERYLNDGDVIRAGQSQFLVRSS